MKEAKLKESTRAAIDAATSSAIKSSKSTGVGAGKPTRGVTNRFVGAGMDKCCICGLKAHVVKVQKEEMEDGRMLITRQIKCTGKHRHTYPMKEIVING